jgi:putative DNA primase/helicase
MSQTKKITDFNCPQWINYLTQDTGGDTISIAQLQEYTGSCLDPETCWGTALLLSGKGMGKTIFMKILSGLVGKEKTSFVSIDDFENTFLRATLKDKWLNLCQLNRKEDLELPFFKAVVTGDPVSASIMLEGPIDFTPSCKLVIETNHSINFQRRSICVSFDYQPAEPNYDLFDMLLKEIDGIRAWAEEGLQRLKRQGHFTKRNTPNEPAETENKETIEIETDLIKRLWEYATRARIYFDQFPPKSIEFQEKDHIALTEALRELFTNHLNSSKQARTMKVLKSSNQDLQLKELRAINKSLQVLANRKDA